MNIIDHRTHNIVTPKGVIRANVYGIVYDDKVLSGFIIHKDKEYKVYQRRSLWHVDEVL
jgi:hypothetical protein